LPTVTVPGSGRLLAVSKTPASISTMRSVLLADERDRSITPVQVGANFHFVFQPIDSSLSSRGSQIVRDSGFTLPHTPLISRPPWITALFSVGAW